MSDSTVAASDQTAADPQIRVFGADWCGDCRRAKRVLNDLAVPFEWIDLVEDPSAADVARDISGRTNIPVVTFPDGTHQVEPSDGDLRAKLSELGIGSAHGVSELPSRSRVLSSGLVAEIEDDRFVPGAVQLVVDGTPQSHVNLDDPSDLFFEYVRRIGHVIDLFRPSGTPISALHLGGGAFTLPRYVEATRPGSRQQVIEIEDALVDLVREHAPLPKRASIRVRRGDARAVLAKLPAGMQGAMDLVVVDIFAGARTPAHVSSLEFYDLIRPLLAPDGLVVLNAADGSGLPFVRGQAATLAARFANVVAVAEPQVLKGRRFGNVVLIASNGDVGELDWLPRLLAGGPHPARMLEGDEIAALIRGTAPVTDATAVDSPAPARELFGRG